MPPDPPDLAPLPADARADCVRAWLAAHPGQPLRLPGAALRRADLADAPLDEAHLAEADLSGARLAGASLAKADLAGALLEEADLTGAKLRFAKFDGAALEGANLAGADLWGAVAPRVGLAHADLRGANFEESDFSGADLRGADLRGAKLRRANLQGADLTGADLTGAVLRGADLSGAVLREAKLREVDLSQTVLIHAHLADAWLERTRFRPEQLGGAVGEEVTGEYELARRGYLALERNFQGYDPDAVSWAYRRKRRSEKWHARAQARALRARGEWRASLRFTRRAVTHQIVEWVCDYGESVPRVMATIVMLLVLSAVFYGATGSVLRTVDTPDGPAQRPTRDPVDLLLFSLLTMVSLGTPDAALAPRSPAVQLLAGLEALGTIFLTGLLGFVVGNRIRQ